jgi:glycosyltransferase involved in cell wall biosynthesis
MKKVGFMIVYNDADYVDQALSSFLDFVDEMVVVEGAFEITMKGGKPARSNDGTIEILKRYESEGKITLIHANLREHKDHYNIGYQEAVKRGADWAVMLDSDEIWTPQMKGLVNGILKNHTTTSLNVKEFRIHEYCFINDFKTWYPGVYPRIFKAEKGAFFVFDNEVQFSEGRGRHTYSELNKGFKIFHYGYVRRKQRWRMKQDYMWEKDYNPLNKQYDLKEDKYIIPSDIPIFNFTGKHPEIMQKHPFHNMTAHEIIYGDSNE